MIIMDPWLATMLSTVGSKEFSVHVVSFNKEIVCSNISYQDEK